MNLSLVHSFWDFETSGMEPFFIEEKVTFSPFFTLFDTRLPNTTTGSTFSFIPDVVCTGIRCEGVNLELGGVKISLWI